MRIKSRFVFDIPDEADARKLYEIAGIKFPSKRPTRLYVMELFSPDVRAAPKGCCKIDRSA